MKQLITQFAQIKNLLDNKLIQVSNLSIQLLKTRTRELRKTDLKCKN